MFSLFGKSQGTRGEGLWKYNDFLCETSGYLNSTKKHIISALENFKSENITDEQSVWKCLKYEVRTFSEIFKESARSNKIKSSVLETKLKILESTIRYIDC